MLTSCVPSTCEEHLLQVWASLVEVVCIKISPENILAVHAYLECVCKEVSRSILCMCNTVQIYTTSIDNILRGKGSCCISLPPSNVNLLQVGTAISQSAQSFCGGKTTTPDVQGDEVPGIWQKMQSNFE